KSPLSTMGSLDLRRVGFGLLCLRCPCSFAQGTSWLEISSCSSFRAGSRCHNSVPAAPGRDTLAIHGTVRGCRCFWFAVLDCSSLPERFKPECPPGTCKCAIGGTDRHMATVGDGDPRHAQDSPFACFGPDRLELFEHFLVLGPLV